jgi:TPR repeat protein
MYHLGRLYTSGQGGVAKDETRARGYIEEAARRGHLFARRDVAYQMISGAHGVHRIPLGVLALIRVLCAGYRVALKDPDSELAVRL